ncbi:MAG: hypothetical protein QOE82_1062, partial [Thermoanaerobaculia bacterium]|nr:hypothetical protein [Thermoanaerobaculia bacterium]
MPKEGELKIHGCEECAPVSCEALWSAVAGEPPLWE